MPVARKYTILAVDDYEPHRYALGRVLQKAGFETLAAGTGAEALSQAAKDPDLILLDIGLPDIGGLEVCDTLKADRRTADIPIIFITATHPEEFFVLESRKHGGSGFFTYPLDSDMLVSVIRSCLKQIQEQRKAKKARKHSA